MSRIQQLISEIREIGPTAGHRNAIQLFRILEGNAALFRANIDPDYFNPILRNFESLAESSAKEFSSSSFRDDYSRNYELLMFYCNRV